MIQVLLVAKALLLANVKTPFLQMSSIILAIVNFFNKQSAKKWINYLLENQQ